MGDMETNCISQFLQHLVFCLQSLLGFKYPNDIFSFNSIAHLVISYDFPTHKFMHVFTQSIHWITKRYSRKKFLYIAAYKMIMILHNAWNNTAAYLRKLNGILNHSCIVLLIKSILYQINYHRSWLSSNGLCILHNDCIGSVPSSHGTTLKR